MELEVRTKDGDFLVSFKGVLAETVLNYLVSKEKRLDIVTTKSKKRCFQNNTNDVVAFGGELFEVFVRPKEYIIIN